MDNAVTISISGLGELQAKLESAPLKAAKQAMRKGLEAGAFILKNEMEFRVRQGWHHWSKKVRRELRRKDQPTDEVFGYLSRSMVARVTVKNDLAALAEVGPTKAGFYAKFLEFGKHDAPAFPFMRPAFEARKQDVLEEFIIETRAAMAAAGLPLV